MTAYTLIVQTNPVEGREDEYNDWYSNTHLGDVLRIPGFTSAQRFKVAPGFEVAHKYVALYNMETENPGAALEELQKRAGTPELIISTAMDENVGMALYAAITPLVTG
jgi:hypothetical protein